MTTIGNAGMERKISLLKRKINTLQKRSEEFDRKRGKVHDQIREIEKQIDLALLSEFTFKPGQIVLWTDKASRQYRGRILSISIDRPYCGERRYLLRCQRLNKAGGIIGYANVTADQNVSLEKPIRSGRRSG